VAPVDFTEETEPEPVVVMGLPEFTSDEEEEEEEESQHRVSNTIKMKGKEREVAPEPEV